MFNKINHKYQCKNNKHKLIKIQFNHLKNNNQKINLMKDLKRFKLN